MDSSPTKITSDTKTKKPSRGSYWLNIWIRPRRTIRQIINDNPIYGVTLIAILNGIYLVIDSAFKQNLGDQLKFPVILAVTMFFGPLAGIAGMYIGAAYIRWISKWFGGEASPQEMRAAIAWAELPEVILVLFYLPLILLYGGGLFESMFQVLHVQAALNIYAILRITNLVSVIWRLYLMIPAIAEVNRFSIWKAILAMVIASAIVFVPLYLLPMLL